MKLPRVPIKRLLSLRVVFLSTLVVFTFGFGILAMAYVDEKNKHDKLINNSGGLAQPYTDDESTSSLALTNSGGVKPPVNSGSSAPAKPRVNPQVSTNTANPNVGHYCTHTYADIPFIHIFKKGTGPYSPGVNGIRSTCSYSDGRAPVIDERPARNQVNYINVTSQDGTFINNICKNYPAQYYSECEAVVRYDP